MALMLSVACVGLATAASEAVCASSPSKGALAENSPVSATVRGESQVTQACDNGWMLIDPAVTKEQIQNPFRLDWRVWMLLAAWLTLVLLHSVIVWRLVRSRDAEKPRSRRRRASLSKPKATS